MPPMQLHVEVPHPQRAPRRFAHHGEGLGQQVVERRALLQARAELLGLGRAAASSLSAWIAGSSSLAART